MKKVILLIIMCLMLTACNTASNTANSNPTENVLRYGITKSIEHLNPILTEEGHSELQSLVYRGLMKQTETNDVVGDVAKSVTISEDELTYTFMLHEATWHDGQPITADDVKFTLDQIRTPEVASPYFSDFQTVVAVEIVDKHTVQIKVNEPTPTLLHKLKVGLLPQHIYEGQDILTAPQNTAPVGNGPYVLKNWSADDVLTFEANESFYGTTPEIERIIVYTKLDENAKLLRIKSGDLHIAQITPQQKKAVEAYEHVEVKTLQTADYRALQFNQQHAQLADESVRKAINHLINRDQLIQLVLHGTGEQAFGPLQRSFARADADVYRLDVTQATKLLQEAGYKKESKYFENNDGKVLQFNVIAPITDAVRVSLATVIVEQLQAQGVNAILQTKDWSNITIESEDTFMIGWGSEDDPDTHTYRVFHSTEHAPAGYNYALVDNPDINEALEKAKGGTREERIENYATFQQHLAQEMAFSFLVYVDGIYAISDKLVGTSDRILGHNGFGIMWNIEDWKWEDLDG
ncbi:ABC transporter substrate-binding protein [Solibacillus merdavium]|uniref:ABC transporter substrate-binding protein n=1 Tax=Solibacillus merdavium TaxID=2762218 RepID=A0ABR8XKR2_9BACL|nr:ABC transporter substrate-binding protein [Solibacillus merdavium]MBD8032525.1 ABC transporter substrate-binding protein [Solibacillus merdavium]